ncbi:ParA family protein [Myxococcus sp. K38C18041901]|uniref:ParA family protein n=1 Tax=Myxococcus guangdongensis TaxID=2906760 RepID=UPI0020A75BFC|nr:ParA family protein [Myxococcus guangdongensis]MCP3061542.1 ParA family protein [Myxococcus guangdongensis]
MALIAFCTIKGGVGKTTLCAHVASALADAGRRVLVLDMDPQAHASLVLGLESREGPCIAEALGPRPKYRLDDVVVASPKRPTLFIAPAAPRMAAMERELFQWGHRLQAIPRALKTLSWTPDVILVDTPPSIGAYTEAVLAFADLVVAPVPTGAFALQGLGEIEAAWRDVREAQGGDLVAVVNLWDRRTPATNGAMEEALKDSTVPVLRARIPRSESINQAGLGYEVVFDTSPAAPGVEELRSLAQELSKRVGLR